MLKRDHTALRATWQSGQYWETLVDACDIWVPVNNEGLAEPIWDNYQDYRQGIPSLVIGPVLTRDEVRAVFMHYGFTIKPDQTDLKPYVYEAAAAIMNMTAQRLNYRQ